jgi:hypothetical protein
MYESGEFFGRMLQFTVERGKDRGTVLVLHKRRDGSFLASKHKDGPHKQVWKEEDLVPQDGP